MGLDSLGGSERDVKYFFNPAPQTESRGFWVRRSSIKNRSFGLKMCVLFLTDVSQSAHGCV